MASRLETLRLALDKETPQLPPRQSAIARAKGKLIEQDRRRIIDREQALVSRFAPQIATPPRSASVSARGHGYNDMKTILGNVLPARTWLKSMLGSPKLREHVASKHFDTLDRSRTGSIDWSGVQALSTELYSNFGMPPPSDDWLREAFDSCCGEPGKSSPKTMSKAEFAAFFEVYLRSAQARIARQEEDQKRGGAIDTVLPLSAQSGCAGESSVEWHLPLALTESTASLFSSRASLESSASSEAGDAKQADATQDASPRRNSLSDGAGEACCEDERALWGGVGGTLAAMCIFLL